MSGEIISRNELKIAFMGEITLTFKVDAGIDIASSTREVEEYGDLKVY
jgi:hypothetical protein